VPDVGSWVLSGLEPARTHGDHRGWLPGRPRLGSPGVVMPAARHARASIAVGVGQMPGVRRRLIGSVMRIRWYAWVAVMLPALAGVVGLVSDPQGDFRSSGFLTGVAISLGALAVLLLLRRPWRDASRLRALGVVFGIGVLGVVAVGGLAASLPEYLGTQFGWFMDHDDYGPRAVVAVDGAFVAVGDDRAGSVVWQSDNGSTWSRVARDIVEGLEVRDVEVIDGGLVAVAGSMDAGDGVVVTSPDGSAWELAARFGSEVESGFAPIDVAALGDTVVVAGETYGNDAVFFHGPDLDTLGVAEPAPTFDDGDWVVDVACILDGCVAAGGSSDIGVVTTSGQRPGCGPPATGCGGALPSRTSATPNWSP